MKKNNFGFTLIELVIVLGIILTLFGFMAINLVSTQKNVSINSFRDTLVSDMTSQQTKAMQGAGGVAGTNFGIYFQSDHYILFKGSVYSPTDESNFTVEFDEGIEFSNIFFPGQSIIFASGSGEVISFQAGQNSVEIINTQGNEAEAVTVNRYGVVIPN